MSKDLTEQFRALSNEKLVELIKELIPAKAVKWLNETPPDDVIQRLEEIEKTFSEKRYVSRILIHTADNLIADGVTSYNGNDLSTLRDCFSSHTKRVECDASMDGKAKLAFADAIEATVMLTWALAGTEAGRKAIGNALRAQGKVMRDARDNKPRSIALKAAISAELGGRFVTQPYKVAEEILGPVNARLVSGNFKPTSAKAIGDRLRRKKFPS